MPVARAVNYVRNAAPGAVFGAPDNPLAGIPEDEDLFILEQKAADLAASVRGGKKQTGTLVQKILEDESGKKGRGHQDSDKKKKHVIKKKGSFMGVFIPTCENMWGVLIFLRFHYVVGQAGVGRALLAAVLSFSAAFCTTSSMCAVVSSGGYVSKGGPYYMISRALGPAVGVTIGLVKWFALTLLSVLEVLGAVEVLIVASPSLEFAFNKQAFGSVFMFALAACVGAGSNFVGKLGAFFVVIIFLTLSMYYGGLATAPITDAAIASPYVTGLSWETLQYNWGPNYQEGVHFGTILGVFFPCFTGILSGANRADTLRDPPKNIKIGTFGAIIFSFFMYTSFFVLWGMVAEWPYLQGSTEESGDSGASSDHGGSAGSGHRRLSGGAAGSNMISEIVFNPFPHAAEVGIIICSISQALQCLIVAPRLLQSIAKDDILKVLSPLAPLSNRGEPLRALLCTYFFAAALVMIGDVNAVAPLLTMCFLVAYTFMNFSCCLLVWLRSSSFRPPGIHHQRWRLYYIIVGFSGFCICISIMFMVEWVWAIIALTLSFMLYLRINWKTTERQWGSALDGVRFQLAFNSLMQLEDSQKHVVNWRPQILVVYKLKLEEELNGLSNHAILTFCSQLRKGKGFCIVACILEAEHQDEESLRKAAIEKSVVKSLMKSEGIQGFAEVVVSPSWAEGTSYIIQLAGIGGISPNTVMLTWPSNWQTQPLKAKNFAAVLHMALVSKKAILAVKGVHNLPIVPVYGTIDIWWMVHDGGFLILLAWILQQHRVWRQCHVRIFTVADSVSQEGAKNAARLLKVALQQRRFFDVEVEVILTDGGVLEPYTYDSSLRLEQRHILLEQLGHHRNQDLPMQLEELFENEEDHHSKVPSEPGGLGRSESSHSHHNVHRSEPDSATTTHKKIRKEEEEDWEASIHVFDLREYNVDEPVPFEREDSVEDDDEVFCRSENSKETAQNGDPDPDKEPTLQESPKQTQQGLLRSLPELGPKEDSVAEQRQISPKQPPQDEGNASLSTSASEEIKEKSRKKTLSGARSWSAGALQEGAATWHSEHHHHHHDPHHHNGFPKQDLAACSKLNEIIYNRSRRAQLVVTNMPDLWSTDESQVDQFLKYCDTLTNGLEQVLFVHSSGEEIFDFSV